MRTKFGDDTNFCSKSHFSLRFEVQNVVFLGLKSDSSSFFVDKRTNEMYRYLVNIDSTEENQCILEEARKTYKNVWIGNDWEKKSFSKRIFANWKPREPVLYTCIICIL